MKRFKRIAALLLALSMLAAAGCAENPADTSSGTEGSESSSGAESSDPNPFVEPEVNEIRDTINALYGNAPDRSLRANNMLSRQAARIFPPHQHRISRQRRQGADRRRACAVLRFAGLGRLQRP